MIYSPCMNIPLGDLIFSDGGKYMIRIKRKAVFDNVLVDDIINLATKARVNATLKVVTQNEGLRYADIRLVGGIAVLEFKYHDKIEVITVADYVSYLLANSRNATNAGYPLRDSRITPTTEHRPSC